MTYRIFYISASNGFATNTQLNEILTTARTRNARDKLTGLLVYNDGSFAQVIEGPEDNVKHCYERIKKDKRHCGCELIFSESSDERLFKDWSMGYIPHTDISDHEKKSLIDLRDLSSSPSYEAAACHVILNSFLKNFLIEKCTIQPAVAIAS